MDHSIAFFFLGKRGKKKKLAEGTFFYGHENIFPGVFDGVCVCGMEIALLLF